MIETATHGTITLTIENRLAYVQLQRPEKLNSLTREVFEDLVEIGQRLRNDESVACVVITGAGQAFCAGLDLKEFQTIQDGEESSAVVLGERLGAARALGQQSVHIWSLIEVPVIAGVQGVAMGGGLQLAIGADVTIVAPDTKMSMMEINWGIIPDLCGTQVLPRRVGASKAKLLTFTGEVFSGSYAGEIGVADEVHDHPVERAFELGQQIADKSRSALVWAKKLIDMAGNVELSEGFDSEQQAIAELVGAPEQLDAVNKQMAYLAERKNKGVS